MADWQALRLARPGTLPPLSPLTSAAAPLAYAGFWVRFCAVFVDGLLMFPLNILIALMCGKSLGAAIGYNPSGTFGAQDVLVIALQLLAGISYETFFIGRFAATPGKMALGLRVINADGSPVSYLKAFARYFGKLLSAFTCLIGYIIAAFDGQKRALHDHLCATRVVSK